MCEPERLFSAPPLPLCNSTIIHCRSAAKTFSKYANTQYLSFFFEKK